MGAIHLTAIEECAEVEQRYDFLTRQRDDLETALGALRQAISQINRASRERFQEAFDAVNDMFQKVYPRLFRGGVARLELTHADDVLDAGVDIIAMPPGKKLQNVGLLSGGEKALTATALVFRHLSHQAESLLHPRRGRCPVGRSQRAAFQRYLARNLQSVAVHRHHAQQADDGCKPTGSTASPCRSQA